MSQVIRSGSSGHLLTGESITRRRGAIRLRVAAATALICTTLAFGESLAGADTSKTMPNVVCRNLQEAQDTIQRAGVFYSRSRDATGQRRLQLIDKNWLVVRQKPAPGAPIREGKPLLFVVKYGEANDCGL